MTQYWPPKLALLLVLAAAIFVSGPLAGQEIVEGGTNSRPQTTDPAKVFEQKFAEYKSTIRAIEKLQADFQSADSTTRQKLNAELAGQVAHAQTQMNALLEAAIEAYRAAPNADKRITDLLISVAGYYTIGRQVGPGQSAPDNPGDVYYPIDGGDQYERALPIVTLLIDGHTDHKELFVWGFLCAFATNDYGLAKRYLQQAQESGAFESIATSAAKSDKEDPQAGLMKGVAQLVNSFAAALETYPALWAKEAALRDAEAKADDLPRVKLTTTKGEIVVELFENEAPQSVANFITLVKQGFYNGTPFHRVLPKFMAQGGDPTGTGTGGPGYAIRGEAHLPNHRSHFRGSLSMAHSGHPDSGGSQFFLTFVPTLHLNGRHTVFGRVVEGIEVLADLQRRSPQHQPTPPTADRILKAEVVRDRGHEYPLEKLPER
jgi:cyclophilin family peptidyl-prolyl cis-trans isomerase